MGHIYVNDIINTIKRITEALRDASMKAGLEVNIEKTTYILMACHQNGGQNHNLKTAHWSVENIASSHMWQWQQQIQNNINVEIESR